MTQHLQAGDMGSARMGLGATVHRFKKVCYVLQHIRLLTSCITLLHVQVFEEPQKKQMLYWVIAIVAVLFVLYNLIKYSRR